MVYLRQFTCAAILLLLFAASAAAWAEDSAAQPDDEAAIRQAVESYIKAFNSRDAEKMAAHWSPEGVYISRDTVERITGREALQREFQRVFEGAKDVKLQSDVHSIEFVSPNVALEQGEAVLTAPDAEPERTSYSVVHVRRDGKWLIDRITEETVPHNPRHENLKRLQWMLGTWTAPVGEDTLRVECNWAKNNNYLVRAFMLKGAEEDQASGLQIIGWDAAKKEIRSWLFDSEGGFVSGHWVEKGDRWLVESTAMLADGGLGSFTSVLKPIDADHIAWQKINQIVDGQLLPNLDEVMVTRQ